MNIEDSLQRQIPHRLDALAMFTLMYRLRMEWEEAKPMQVFVAGRLEFDGNTNALTNPVFEAGLLHCRALLEFLGLKVDRSGALKNVELPRRNSDDAGIEKLQSGNTSLPLVTPGQAIAAFSGDPAIAEAALVAVMGAANKGMAHLTTQYTRSPANIGSIAVAAELIPLLVEHYVYAATGVTRPPSALQARPR